VKRRAETVDYSSRIEEITVELQSKTLGEAEKDRNITQFDYSGVGYGYNLKDHYPKNLKEALADTKTPELNRLKKLVKKQGL
jgi:hypothetical protein